jgi:signal peptidase I
VVGLPGDHIRYLDRRLIINEVPAATAPGRPDDSRGGLNYQYAEVIEDAASALHGYPSASSAVSTATVPSGHFMALGDSRDNARDSRYLG